MPQPQRQQGQTAPAQPAGQNQPQGQGQGQGQGQAHVGECALTVTSPSTLTSFSDRWAVREVCRSAERAGEQLWGERGPIAKGCQCAKATVPEPARHQMAQYDAKQLSAWGRHGTRWLVVNECAGLWSRGGGPGCKSMSMSLCRRATHPNKVI
jgi:hypothetical protein